MVTLVGKIVLTYGRVNGLGSRDCHHAGERQRQDVQTCLARYRYASSIVW